MEKRQRGTQSNRSSKRRRRWISRVSFLLVVISGFLAWQWRNTLWAYKPAPSFTLQASNGRLISLGDYRGKQEVVIIFYMGAG